MQDLCGAERIWSRDTTENPVEEPPQSRGTCALIEFSLLPLD